MFWHTHQGISQQHIVTLFSQDQHGRLRNSLSDEPAWQPQTDFLSVSMAFQEKMLHGMAATDGQQVVVLSQVGFASPLLSDAPIVAPICLEGAEPPCPPIAIN